MASPIDRDELDELKAAVSVRRTPANVSLSALVMVMKGTANDRRGEPVLGGDAGADSRCTWIAASI